MFVPQSLISVTLRATLVVIAIVFLLAPLLFQGHIFAFRDAFHFYWPWWFYLDQQELWDWCLPQFNMLDRVGTSVIGEPTSGIFYPLRLILAVDVVSLECRVALLLAIHVLIAWANMFYVARRMRSSTSAASLSASSYALGGGVFFLVYNPPYLFAAAWLPAMLGVLLSSVSERQKILTRDVVLAILCLVLIITAGDFQLLYNLGILWCASIVLVFVRTWKRNAFLQAVHRLIKPSSAGFAVLLSAVLLCAVQIVPTWKWATAEGAWQVDRQGISDRFVLEFYDLVTWLTPHVFGSYTPTHTRWIASVASPMMVPSIHFSLPLFVAFAAGIIRKKTSTNFIVALTIVVFSLTAAAGDSLGLYSVLKMLPGYGSFRYPFKWTVPALATICLLGAQGFDLARYKAAFRRRLARGAMLLVVLNGIVMLIAAAVGISAKNQWLDGATVPADILCGAFNLAACWQQIFCAALITMCAGAACWKLLGKVDGRVSWRSTWLIEIIAVVQLVLLNWLTIATVGSVDHRDLPPVDMVWESARPAIGVYYERRAVGQKGESIAATYPFTPNDTTRLQMMHVVGKLHLLARRRNMHAQLSIDPPEYIENSISLNQVIPRWIVAESARNLVLDWKNSMLELQVGAGPSGDVVLPVLQDGGWQLHDSSSMSGENAGVNLVDRSDHLLQLHLPSDVSHVKLSYFTPGLRLGATISVAAVIVFCLFGLTYYVRNVTRRAA